MATNQLRTLNSNTTDWDPSKKDEGIKHKRQVVGVAKSVALAVAVAIAAAVRIAVVVALALALLLEQAPGFRLAPAPTLAVVQTQAPAPASAVVLGSIKLASKQVPVLCVLDV